MPSKKKITVAVGDIKFEERLDKVLADLSKDFVQKMITFFGRSVYMISQNEQVPEKKVASATIFEIMKAMGSAGVLRSTKDLTLNTKAKIKDTQGRDRNVFFVVNISEKPGGKGDGLFHKHHAGGGTMSLEGLPEDKVDKGLREVSEKYNLTGFTVADRIIEVDLSGQISFQRFVDQKNEVIVSLLGLLSHEMSHAHDDQGPKADKKYHQTQRKMDSIKEQMVGGRRGFGVMQVLQDELLLILMAADRGKSPYEMKKILEEKAEKLQAEHDELFARYLNSPHEMKSALKEFRIFLDALSTGEFVESFRDIRPRFQQAGYEEKTSLIKELLMSIGTWHRISGYLNEKNKVMVFKFIYKLLTEEVQQAEQDQETNTSPSQDSEVEEFEVSND